MKTIRIAEPGRLELVDEPMAAAGEGEVLLRMRHVGFCGSDLNTYRGRNAMAKPRVVPGHEIGAVVEALGPGVPEGAFAPGDVVTVDPYTACGTCSSCRRRRFNACRSNQTLGVQRDGAMRESISVPWRKIIPARGLSTRDAALVEPMSVGFHAVDRGETTDADRVLVFGCGMVGLGAVVRAARRGAEVYAVDLSEEKLDIAKRCGAADAFTSVPEGFSADVVIEAAGSPATYRAAVDAAAFSGRVVCIGYAKSDVSFETRLFVQKELDIRGSRNARPEDFTAAMRAIEAMELPMDEFASRVVPPEAAALAMADWDASPGSFFRILVEW